jgi:hypothetical protein
VKPLSPLPGFNTRPLARVEFRNDHRGQCTCCACVMVRVAAVTHSRWCSCNTCERLLIERTRRMNREARP